mgnify:CR=1 FL=1
MPYVLAAVQDMIFATRVREAARSAGVELRTAVTPAALGDALRGGAPALALFDLSDPRCPALDLLRALRADPACAAVPTVGFFSHVEEQVRLDALAAGCGEVLPRSRFVQELPAILQRASAP